MCATVFYTKQIKSKLYPKVARTGPYAFAQEVSRARGELVTRYIGIVKVPQDALVIESDGEADKTKVIERGEENDNHSREPEQV